MMLSALLAAALQRLNALRYCVGALTTS